MACFGGAGGQHACAIARSLGMGTVFVHKYAGILSAYGMALADVVEEAQEPSAEIYEQGIFNENARTQYISFLQFDVNFLFSLLRIICTSG